MGYILAFITYFGWGAGDIFGIYATRKIGAYKTTSLVFLFGFLVASLYLPFALSDITKLSIGLVLLNIIMGTALMSGNYMLNEAFKRSSASVVGILVQAFPAVVLLLSALIYKDPISRYQILWVLIIFLGMFLCTVNLDDFLKRKFVMDSGVKLALIAAIIFSLYFTFFRIFINAYGWFWANYITISCFPLALFLITKVFRIKEKLGIPHKRNILLAALLSAILLRGGDIALNLGIASGYTSIVAPIAGASPTLFVTLSSLVFKDPVTPQQKIGIGIALFGILMLSFFS